MPLKVLDLFSGIGGFSLGLECTGYFETVAFCEKDEFCKKVLQKHWSQLKIYDDVRSLHDTKIQADVVTGGFPCQAFSQAGLQKGRTDDRWLWNEMFDVIKQVKPRWVIGENVQGIINIEEGMVLRQVQNDLEGEGFKVQCFIIPASGIGAWHNRKRVWILANSNSRVRGRWGAIGQSRENKVWRFYFEEEEQTHLNIRSKIIGHNAVSREDVPNTSIKRPQGNRLSTNMEEKQRRKDFSTKTSAEEQQTWWQTESRICRIPDGVSYGVDRDRAKRIKALGNSIVPQIARQIGLAIMKAENDN